MVEQRGSLEEQREGAWARRSELQQGEQRSWTRRGKDAMGNSRQPFLEQRKLRHAQGGALERESAAGERGIPASCGRRGRPRSKAGALG